MLKMETVRAGHRAIGQIEELYARAFPENERRPLGPLIEDRAGIAEMLALYDGEAFVGFVSLLNWKDIAHIIYFAVEEELRGRGYGAQTLEMLYAQKRGCRLIADVEEAIEGAPNAGQRARRIAFYERLGFARSSVRYAWRGEEYVILSRGGDITPDEFRNFWHEIDAKNKEMGQY